MLKRISLSLLIVSSIVIASCSSGDDSGTPPVMDDTPVAADDTLTVEENSTAGTSNQVTVSSNDDLGDDGGGSDNYTLLSNPSNGAVTEVSDGVFEYIPNVDFNGTDSFTYEVSDSDGDKAIGTVNVTVNEYVPSAEDFNNIDPNFPSFVSIDDTTPDGKKWTKVEALSDEFDTWDDSKWYNSFWNYGNTPVWMRAENSGVEDGKFYIKATLRDHPTQWFQTARVHSKTKISYPMYTECSMKTAHISAFNTFWMNNGDIDDRDEIDIVENNSNPTAECRDQSTKPADFPWTPWDFPTQMNSQYFIAENGNTIRHEDNYDTRWLLDTNPKKDKTWNEVYHTVGVWWIDDRNVQFYLDGEPAGKLTTGKAFTRELELIWDLWTYEECNIGGLPEKEELNDDSINTMRVDWVRTWKLEDE